MSFVEWLSTPGGIELTHAFVVLLLAVSAWISYRTREHAKRIESRLDGHIRRAEEAEQRVTQSDP